MTNPKARRLFILAHLWFAGLLAPAFLLVAVSGGLYLIGNKGEFKSTPVTLPASASLDFQSPSLEQDVRDLLASANIDHKFEYIRNRGTVIQLRPTSRTYLEFRQSEAGLTATRKVPDLQGKLIELHKGHGPQAFNSGRYRYRYLLYFGFFGLNFSVFLSGGFPR